MNPELSPGSQVRKSPPRSSLARNRFGAGLVVVAALLSGCDDTLAPVDPVSESSRSMPTAPGAALNGTAARTSPSSPLQVPPVTINDEFARLARAEIPGFGGFFFDEQGNTVVQLVDRGQATKAAEVLMRDLGNRRILLRDGREALKPLVFRQADYSFLQLQDWFEKADELFRISGVVLTDVDEVQNRLRIGVEDLVARALAEEVLTELGIPRTAVVFEEIHSITFEETLSDWARPLDGGRRILWSGGSGRSGYCTLGFNARRSFSTTRYAVVNSHCTDQQFSPNGGTSFYQPSLSSAFYPALFTTVVGVG